MAPLGDNLAHDFGFRGIRPSQQFLLVGAHGQDVCERNFPAYFAGQGFHLDGVPRHYPILLTSASNDGVHRPSRDNSETMIIRVVSPRVNAKVSVDLKAGTLTITGGLFADSTHDDVT